MQGEGALWEVLSVAQLGAPFKPLQLAYSDGKHCSFLKGIKSSGILKY